MHCHGVPSRESQGVTSGHCPGARLDPSCASGPAGLSGGAHANCCEGRAFDSWAHQAERKGTWEKQSNQQAGREP